MGKTLGTGAFGRVRIGYYLKGNRRKDFYAMKCLKKAELIQRDQVWNACNEKRIIAALKHPFVIKLFGTYQDKRHLYLCLEYIVGGTEFCVIHILKFNYTC